MTINKILEEFEELREQFYRHSQSWGRSDAEKWFDTQVTHKLETLEQETREKTLKEVEEMMKYKPSDYTHTNGKSYHSEIEILKALTELRKG